MIEASPLSDSGMTWTDGQAESVAYIELTLGETVRSLIGANGVALVLREGDFCHYVAEDAIGPPWKGKKFPMAAELGLVRPIRFIRLKKFSDRL
jgi:hypothetical protein